ncbi:hypothetical protein [Hydrogenimonas sp.]
MNWHKSFTAALIEEDEKRLLALLDSMPEFESIEDMQSALELISRATKVFETKKSVLGSQMRNIKSEKKFFTSSAHSSPTRIDIHS